MMNPIKNINCFQRTVKKIVKKINRQRTQKKIGLNLDRVFNCRRGWMHAMHLVWSITKLTNLELKTRP